MVLRMMVSVIIITKNNAATIEKCIQSLINQEYPKELMEIIFVDGHSSDGTDVVIKKYASMFPFIKLYYEDVGTMGYARNVGINNSKGEIILFTDADAFPEKLWIKKMVDAFSNNSKIAIVGGLDILINTDSVQSVVDSWRRLHRSFGIKAIPKIKTVNFAIRRDILVKIGGFDEKLNHADEGDLKARVISEIKDAEILYDPKIVVYHQRGPMKFSNRMKKLFKKSSMGVPVMLRKHMLRVYLRNISSPSGTSLCFIFACLLSPLLLLYLLLFPQNLIPILIGIISIGFVIIAFYTISVKRATGKWFLSLPLILVLDIIVRLAGTYYGLIKWFFFRLHRKT
ncbi:MAG: glycosyltransferase [Candidatus Bathyarchaeia archaeon]